jgi:prepilin-type N-terminal cleavage/methylation domain-containing protein
MPKAFTLVELLVVITIIVILLALLAPAMDQAIYQAELATCGTRMNATAKGVNIYAADFKRNYPYRQYIAEGQNDTSAFAPWMLKAGDQAAGLKAAERDDRRPLKGYVDLKLLVDALCKPVDLNHRSSWIYSSNTLWFGWRYKGQEGMTKVGNRLTWLGQDSQGSLQTFKMNWLITDADDVSPAGSAIPWNMGSHPDELGILHNMAVEAGVKDNDDAVTQAGGTLDSETNSKWVSWGVWDRGEIEMNAAAADGSVTRYNDVDTVNDERMGRAPLTPGSVLSAPVNRTRRDGSSAATPGRWLNVPVR